MKKFLFYLPRILSVLIIALIAPFVLEGFSPGFTWVDSLMHLLVVLFVLVATIVAWKYPKIGGWIFVVIGLKYLVMVFRPGNDLVTGLIFGGIPALAGILFLAEGFRKK